MCLDDFILDVMEVNKKKSLPLWLREGLEKLEKDKKKQEKTEKEIPDAKNVSGYQHASPPSTPEQKEEVEALTLVLNCSKFYIFIIFSLRFSVI